MKITIIHFVNSVLQALSSVFSANQFTEQQSSNTLNQHQYFGISKNETFLKLLLRLQTIQSKVFSLLAQKLVQHSMNNKDENYEIAKSILHHMSYCEVVYSPRYLMLLLFDIVAIIPFKMQLEVITTLPGKLKNRTAAF